MTAEPATLDDFMALNEQLDALVKAGVPIDIGLGRQKDVAAALEKINALVARRVSQGASLSEALRTDHTVVMPSYRGLVQLGLKSGSFSTALAQSHRLAQAVENSRDTAGLSLLYPLVVCSLAFVGLVSFCLFLVPVMDNIYRSVHLPAGLGLRTLDSLRHSLPYWAGILPLGLLLFAGWSTRSRRTTESRVGGLTSILPGTRQAIFHEQAANFAEAVATLLDSGASLAEAMDIAADAWSDPALVAFTRTLAARVTAAQPPLDDNHLAHRFPPFLLWALLHSEASTGRSRALRMAAGLYREMARRRQDRLRVAAPLVAAVVMGGGATLLYGLALFAPVID